MKKEQIPNLLTIGRILFIPIFIFILTIVNGVWLATLGSLRIQWRISC